MSQQQWSAVDDYIVDMLIAADPVLTEALERNLAGGLPQHDVSPAQGKFLHLIARMIGAKNVAGPRPAKRRIHCDPRI